MLNFCLRVDCFIDLAFDFMKVQIVVNCLVNFATVSKYLVQFIKMGL